MIRVVLALGLVAAIASAQKVKTFNENILLEVATGKTVYLSKRDVDTGSVTSDEIATLTHTSNVAAELSSSTSTEISALASTLTRSLSTAVGTSETTMSARNAAHRAVLNQSITRLMESLDSGLETTSTAALAQDREVSSLRSQVVAGASCAVEGRLFNGSSCAPIPQRAISLDTNLTMPNCTAALVGRSRIGSDNTNRSFIEVCVEPGRWNQMSQDNPGTSQRSPAASCAETAQLGMTSGTYWINIGGTGAVEVYCRNDIRDGGWALAMNIHNSDRHSSAWASTHPNFTPNSNNPVPANRQTYWLKDLNYMPNGAGEPFRGDYKHQSVWKNFSPQEIMIVRSDPRVDRGNPAAYKIWSLQARWQIPLLNTFRTTYRTQISTGVHTTSWSASGQAGVNRFCPLMRFGGNLLTNFYYSNNGARFILSGQPRGLSGENENDDDSIGFGMEFSSYSGNRRLSGSNGAWCFDTGIAECMVNGGSPRCPMGSDHCYAGNTNTDYGQYSFYVR